MKLAGLAFTAQGVNLCDQIGAEFIRRGHEFQRYTTPFVPDLKGQVETLFSHCDGLIFVGAAGIAVRAIAPFVRSKTTDPAVVVVDEQGRFSISLLSGHIGGANDLALFLAEIIGARPVITTATDGRKLFSVDRFAARKGLWIGDMTAAKEVSAALLSGKPIGVECEFPVEGRLPKGFVFASRGKIGLSVSIYEKEPPFERTLFLVPPAVTLGIGCRKGISKERIRTAVEEAIEKAGLSMRSVGRICSIDLKAEEAGLLEFCQERDLPFQVFSSEELSQVKGAFSASDFVEGVTGVDNVCERAAVLGAAGGPLLLGKQVKQGVTVAAARNEWRICFED